MKITIICSIASVISLWALFVLFLAVMALKRARDEGRLKKGSHAYNIGLSVLFVGWVIDFAVNMVPASILFLEPPFEMTVSARASRLVKDGGWRGDLARWLCDLLGLFEISGKHCG